MNISRTLRRVPMPALLALVVAGCGSDPASAPMDKRVESDCARSRDARVRAMTDEGVKATSALGLARGRYALPESAAPTHLVVMFHGHGNDSCSWRNHLRNAAARGAVAVAMDYTGTRPEGSVEHYGWPARAGATDSIAAARHFLETYPSLTTVTAFAVSMGGNMAGVAIASPDAVRADGAPLWNYWIDIEGVNNLVEEYAIVRSVAPFNTDAALAQAEIEEENGGAIEDVPERYAEITNVARAPDMAALAGAIVINGFDDGLVPTNQSPEMAVALAAVGVPVREIHVALRGDGESGTTGTAIVAKPVLGALGHNYESPLAGHAWEGSDTHLVMKAGLEQLWRVLADAPFEPGYALEPGV